MLVSSLIIYRARVSPGQRVPAECFIAILVTFLAVTALTVVQLYRALSHRE